MRAMIPGKVFGVQTFGDQLLKDTGVIRIPFFSEDRFFQLVIDSRNKRIYTEDGYLDNVASGCRSGVCGLGRVALATARSGYRLGTAGMAQTSCLFRAPGSR